MLITGTTIFFVGLVIALGALSYGITKFYDYWE